MGVATWSLKMINVLWLLGLALLPNLFRPGFRWGDLTLRFPGCIAGWICYMVYLESIGTPRANLIMLIDSLQTARKMHWRHYSAVIALRTMLKGERANRWLLPPVRMDKKHDLLVWSELCDLIDHQSRSATFRLTEIALIFDILLIVTMMSFAGYAIWQDPSTFGLHVVLV